MEKAWRAWLSAWEDWRVEAEEYRELDGERILVFSSYSGRGKRSGLAVGQMRAEAAMLFHVRDGKVPRFVGYWDRDRALADLGLQESVMAEESTTPGLEELMRRLSDATSRRDLDSMMRFFAPDAVFDVSSMGFGTFEGRAAIRQALEDWWAAYEEYEFELVEIGDLGHGVTFGIARQRARLSGSTGSVELRIAAVAAWEDGLIHLDALYTDIDEARAAAERLAKDRG